MSEDIRHDVGLDGRRIDALHKVPRRPDLDRYPGESNRDALRRISGIAMAAEQDRDNFRRALIRVEALMQTWEANAGMQNYAAGHVPHWVQVRRAIAGDDGPAPQE